MKRLIAALIGLVLFLPPALAADFGRPVLKAPPSAPPIYSWAGFYLGGYAGAAWARQKAFENAGDDLIITTDAGFIGGGQIGYNWQFAQWLIGVEGDLGYLGIKNSAIFGGDDLFESKYGLYGTATGRLGYAGLERSLIYMKGGFIIAGLSLQSSFAIIRDARKDLMSARARGIE